MEKIYRGNGFAVIERNGEFQITFPKGVTGEPVFFSHYKSADGKSVQVIRRCL